MLFLLAFFLFLRDQRFAPIESADFCPQGVLAPPPSIPSSGAVNTVKYCENTEASIRNKIGSVTLITSNALPFLKFGYECKETTCNLYQYQKKEPELAAQPCIGNLLSSLCLLSSFF